MDTCTTIIATIVGIAVAYVFLRKPSTNTRKTRVVLTEHYDPQDMGGRNYWGFGREYGYPSRDMDHPQQQCYQVSNRHLCREGYSRKINPVTLGDQCCVNSYVWQ